MKERRYSTRALGRDIICLGKQGENSALKIKFDCSEWMSEYPDGSIVLYFFSPGRLPDHPIKPELKMDGTDRVWTVSETDTMYSGNGMIELVLEEQETGTILKSATGRTNVIYSPSAKTVSDENGETGGGAGNGGTGTGGTGTGEDGGYYKPSVSSAGDLSWTPSKSSMPSVPTVNIKGPTGATGATGQQGKQGETGPQGPAGADGEDGYSPTITVAPITGGHRVTITDVNGTKYFDVMDGADGKDGSDYILTEEDKQEIARQAAELVEVPEGGSITVDSELSENSTNPVQNAVVTKKLNDLSEAIDAQDERLTTLEQAGGIATVEPANGDIPMVFFSGDTTGMTKDDEKVLSISYKSKTSEFDGFVKMKWQGSSSLSFPKKNFTIKMFEDEACETKINKTFRDWKYSKNKYVLKANYIDHTHARNIITANLWTEMVASRPDFDSLPEALRNSPKNGAIDGFPIKLYMNGVYQGVYTWNIGKDDWMFGMDGETETQAVLCAEKNNNGNAGTTDGSVLACEFRANASINGNDWSLEVPDTLSDSIKNSFNALINTVKDTTDEQFISTIGNHLDLTSALDYYILMYFSAAADNLGKNLLMVTYDGTKWFCSAYDMDNIWGSRGTNTFVDADYACPEEYYETNSLLWQRIEACFGAELLARYRVLREKILTFPNVISKFERFCNSIGTELYKEDVEIYSGIPYPDQNNLKQIRAYFEPRAEYVDVCFDKIGTSVPCTGITLDQTVLTFTATGYKTLTATVTPDNTTDPVIWSSSTPGVAAVHSGVVTAITNGSTTITASCGEYSATCEVSVSGIDPGEIVYIEDGLEMYIDARDISDPTQNWVDRANGHEFTLSGFSTSALEGTAVTFSGNQSAICTDEVDTSGGVTLEFCLTVDPTQTCNRFYRSTMVAIGSDPSGSPGILHANGWGGRYGFVVDVFGGNKMETGEAVLAETRYTVALTSTSDGLRTLYVNGTEVLSGTTYGKNISPMCASIGGKGYSSEMFVGTLSAFRMYKRPLTASEIMENYNVDVQRFA